MDDMLSLQDIVDEVDTHRGRKPGIRRIVVAGEFESGKSSVINAIAGEVCVPCNPGLPGRPLIKVSHSAYPILYGEDQTGRTFEAQSMDEFATIENLAFCTMQIPVSSLQRTEIIEIPYHPGTGMAADDFAMMAGADLIVWVTIASQAWRLSEKALIEKLPPKSRHKSVLAVSRADLLRYEEDWEKVETRLHKEASPYFSEMVFMQASLANLGVCHEDNDIWVRTGGPSLMNIAHELCAARTASPRSAGGRA